MTGGCKVAQLNIATFELKQLHMATLQPYGDFL